MPISYSHFPLDLIRARTSVRRFTGEILAQEARNELDRCCRDLTGGPFGTACRFQIVDNHSRDPGQRVGAYGIIRGARTYLAGAAQQSGCGLEDFGYLFELLLLKATDLELGSCWLGGTFSRSRFAAAIGLRQGEVLPAVSPIGVPTQKRGLVDRVMRWGAGSQQRKPWPELFSDSGAPLSEARAGRFALALEMVRLAPSASNRQPWRCLLDAQTVHFYLQRSPGYRSRYTVDLQRIDLGIAMCHFDLAMAAAEIPGRWEVLDPPLRPQRGLLPASWRKAEYLLSWRGVNR